MYRISPTCVDGDWSEESEAERTFTNNIRSGNDNVDDVTHYIIGDYWYTADLVEEYDSVATTIHRRNAQLALTVQLLSNSLDDDQIVDLYDDLITDLEGHYTVQDYEAGPVSLLTETTKFDTTPSTTDCTPVPAAILLI